MTKETKIIRIGNSKGVRIPKGLLLKYNLQDEVILEEHSEGILIHSKSDSKLSWEDTYKAMSKDEEKWEDWHVLDDGWESLD